MIPFLIPESAEPSGGHVYNAHIAAGLGLREVVLPGPWPEQDQSARIELAAELAMRPQGSQVIIDGLVACGQPDILVPQAKRLKITVLVHLPLADETGADPELERREGVALRAVHAVIATSESTARDLVHRHGIPAHRVHIAVPGTEPAPLAPGTDGRGELLCVASLTPRKGHELLLDALARVPELDWRCTCTGPGNPEHLREITDRTGIGERVRFTGPLTGTALAQRYVAADLFVLASHAETFGMVFTEAIARGIPVLATAVGAVRETVGEAGLLVEPGDPDAFAAALRRWFAEEALRVRLRKAARARRTILSTWEETVRCIGRVLE
ncbi:glycosyltransferase family 4 protein [Sciscionella sediminilitoris]|uniref:glycosyltransferase family 4 protein n=1 Tax=Sciscionella sediminilitoris TaxID=1445613 RepID=UPI00068D1DED|nr:glycosyltransferase family 4 protein [Sciscionella sp. SE31]